MSNQTPGGKARFAPTEWLAGLAAAVQDDNLLSPQERASVLLSLRQGNDLGSAMSFWSITFHLVDGQVVRTAVLREERCPLPGNGKGRRAAYSLHLKEANVVRAAMGWSLPGRFTTRVRPGTWQLPEAKYARRQPSWTTYRTSLRTMSLNTPPEAKYARLPGCLPLPTGRPPRILSGGNARCLSFARSEGGWSSSSR
jgi:hypothetical protein